MRQRRGTETSGDPGSPPGQSQGGLYWFGVITLIAAVVTVVVGIQEPPNKLATALMQAITLAFGVVTAHLYSKISIAEAVKDSIGNDARKSTRRILNLKNALDRHNDKHLKYLDELEKTAITDGNGRKYVDFVSARLALGSLQESTFELQATCQDTLADWNDLVPSDVDALNNAE